MKKNNIIAIAAIALTFTACSNDNDITTNNEGKDTPISLSVGVGELSVVTRAESNTTTPLTTGALGLYITKNGDKNIIDKYLCNNAQFTYNNGWSCGTTYYWAADNATIDYVAYHPYQSTVTGNYISWNVTDQRNVNRDLLYQKASNVTNPTDHTIAITLRHVCSKLVVNVSKLGSEIAEGTKISSIKIGGLKPKGTFNLTDGTWDSSNETAADIEMAVLVTPNQGMKATCEAILIPQTAPFTLTIRLDDNSEYQLAVPSHTFAAGTCYTLTIQVGQDKVNLGNITQTPWSEVNGGPLNAQ